MNSSKTNEILKDIKTNTANTTTNETGTGTTTSDTLRVVSALDDLNWSTSNTNTSNMSSSLISMLSELGELDTINTNLETIYEELVDIGITLGKDENKIFFHSRLDYDGSDLLTFADYSSSPVTGYYSNTSNNKQYITEFNFVYEDASKPNSSNTYHSSAFDCKIGKMNSSNVFEEPYMTIQNNREQAIQKTRHDGYEDVTYCWKYDFSQYPIELETNDRFGQYINGNFSGTYYDSYPVGYVKGYYYNE